MTSGYAIATLVVFIVSCFFVIHPVSIPISRSKCQITINLITAPILAIALLWAAQCLDSTVIRNGFVGTEGVKPYNIVILFFSLAYMAITLDITGILEAAAFWVSNRSGYNGWKLYLCFYLMLSLLSILLGNDPVILSGTAFLVYYTEAAGLDPRAWVLAEFAAANTASMVLFVGNPTNVIICEGFSVNNTALTAYTIIPFLACSIFCFVALAFQYRKHIPRELPRTTHLDPRSALRDPFGAWVGGFMLGTTLILCLVVSFFGIDVWMISLPFAAGKFLFDLGRDYFRITRSISMPGRGSVRTVEEGLGAGSVAEKCYRTEDNSPSHYSSTHHSRSSLSGGLNPIQSGITSSTGPHRAEDDSLPRYPSANRARSLSSGRINSRAMIEFVERPRASPISSTFDVTRSLRGWIFGCFHLTGTAPLDEEDRRTEGGSSRHPSSHNPRQSEPLQTSEKTAVASQAGVFKINFATGLQTLGAQVKCTRSFQQELDDVCDRLRMYFPTFMTVLPRLPFGLIPFTFSQFILLEALNHQGWVKLFADWFVRASNHQMHSTIWLIGVADIILCNLLGTSIGTSIFLNKVVRAAALSYKVNRGAAIALAVTSNIGAVNLTFSASLAGLLLRSILEQKDINMRQKDFAFWNLLPSLAMTAVGLGFVSAEMAVLFGS